jgi:hypothetical protein
MSRISTEGFLPSDKKGADPRACVLWTAFQLFLAKLFLRSADHTYPVGNPSFQNNLHFTFPSFIKTARCLCSRFVPQTSRAMKPAKKKILDKACIIGPLFIMLVAYIFETNETENQNNVLNIARHSFNCS